MRLICFAASLATLFTGTALAQEAYVYDNIPNTGVYAYDAASNGKLTAISGSPFKVEGNMIGTNGSYVVSADSTDLHAYKVESNGAIGELISSIDTQNYSGSECGTISNPPSPLSTPVAEFDHTGQNIYVELNGTQDQYGDGICNGIQTYGISKSGAFTFKGVTELNSDFSNYMSAVLPTLTGNGKFGYGFQFNNENGDLCDGTTLNLFSTESNGTLEYQNTSFENPFSYPSGPPPLPSGAQSWELLAKTDDPTDHMVLAMYWTDDNDCEDYPITSGYTQLGSFTVDSQGNLTTTNTYEDMPTVQAGTDLIKLDPTGKFLAVATGTGVQFFRFNGANPMTAITGVIGVSGQITLMGWDSDDHLYAQNEESGKLHVYEVTTTSAKELSGSPTVIAYSYYTQRDETTSSIFVRTK